MDERGTITSHIYDESDPSVRGAMVDFDYARLRVILEEIIAHLTGKSADLLSFEDVRRKLKAGDAITQGLKDIPLDAIVGSVGRYADLPAAFCLGKIATEIGGQESRQPLTD